MDMTKLPAVAKKIYTMCKKCGVDRYQVVTSHTGPTSARLECEVCHSKSAFKLEEPKARRSLAPKKAPSKSKVAKDLARWAELRDKNVEKPVTYNMRAAFDVGTALEHPKFGLGFVILTSGQAIQVVFEDEERSLVHNRG